METETKRKRLDEEDQRKRIEFGTNLNIIRMDFASKIGVSHDQYNKYILISNNYDLYF